MKKGKVDDIETWRYGRFDATGVGEFLTVGVVKSASSLGVKESCGQSHKSFYCRNLRIFVKS